MKWRRLTSSASSHRQKKWSSISSLPEKQRSVISWDVVTLMWPRGETDRSCYCSNEIHCYRSSGSTEPPNWRFHSLNLQVSCATGPRIRNFIYKTHFGNGRELGRRWKSLLKAERWYFTKPLDSEENVTNSEQDEITDWCLELVFPQFIAGFKEQCVRYSDLWWSDLYKLAHWGTKSESGSVVTLWASYYIFLLNLVFHFIFYYILGLITFFSYFSGFCNIFF